MCHQLAFGKRCAATFRLKGYCTRLKPGERGTRTPGLGTNGTLCLLFPKTHVYGCVKKRHAAEQSCQGMWVRGRRGQAPRGLLRTLARTSVTLTPKIREESVDFDPQGNTEN